MTHVAVEDQSLNEIGQRQTQRVGADAVAAFYMIEVVVEVAGTQVVADIGAEAAFASAEAERRAEINTRKSIVEISGTDGVVDVFVVADKKFTVVAIQVVKMGAKEPTRLNAKRHLLGRLETSKKPSFKSIVMEAVGAGIRFLFGYKVGGLRARAFLYEHDFRVQFEAVAETDRKRASSGNTQAARRSGEKVRTERRVVAAQRETQLIPGLGRKHGGGDSQKNNCKKRLSVHRNRMMCEENLM